MKGIIKNSLYILIPFWLVYFVFYYLDVKYNTYFLMPIVLIIFVLSLISIIKTIVYEEQSFKKKNHLSTYSYLYYSVIIFLLISIFFIFVFDFICKKNDLMFNIYINEGDTDKYLYFMSSFYYYVRILFPIIIVGGSLVCRRRYRLKKKKNRV